MPREIKLAIFNHSVKYAANFCHSVYIFMTTEFLNTVCTE